MILSNQMGPLIPQAPGHFFPCLATIVMQWLGMQVLSSGVHMGIAIIWHSLFFSLIRKFQRLPFLQHLHYLILLLPQMQLRFHQIAWIVDQDLRQSLFLFLLEYILCNRNVTVIFACFAFVLIVELNFMPSRT